MEDVECPYCEKWNKINHADGIEKTIHKNGKNI